MRSIIIAMCVCFFFTLHCGGSSEKSGLCDGKDDCLDFAAIMVECQPPEETSTYQDWVRECTRMPNNMQHAYCVCYELINQGPGCDSDENEWTIDESKRIHQCWCDEAGIQEACECAENPEQEGCN